MKKTKKQIDHSTPLDVHKWCCHLEASFIDILWDKHLEKHIPTSLNKGKRSLCTPKHQFKVLMLNLYVNWKEDPTLLLGVGKSKRYYKVNSRYNSQKISAIMINVIDFAVDEDLIFIQSGNEVSKRTSRVWATQYLDDQFGG